MSQRASYHSTRRFDFGLPGLLLTAGLSVLACRAQQDPGAIQPSPESHRAEVQPAQPNGTAQQAAGGFYSVKGSQLFDRCGEPVILRGVNKMTIWTDRQGSGFGEISKTGANSVRIVWTVKDHRRTVELDQVLARAINARLIPMIELHDATGDLSQVPKLVDFWVRPEIVSLLKHYEAYTLLNIANEAGANDVPLDQFVAVYSDAITRLRGAGLKMPLVIDAPQWGQDIDLLQAAAPKLLAVDPQKNLLFSVHLWWPKDETSDDPGSTKRIAAELAESAEAGLPIIIGEFAHAGVGCSRAIDYKTILAEAQRHGIGWLAWSWGPGNNDCGEMDMTRDGRFETLHGWGLEVAVTDENSIKNTSRIPASVLHGKCPGE